MITGEHPTGLSAEKSRSEQISAKFDWRRFHFRGIMIHRVEMHIILIKSKEMLK
jgi:hypothetical protein